jgi:hypothetical protein
MPGAAEAGQDAQNMPEAQPVGNQAVSGYKSA